MKLSNAVVCLFVILSTATAQRREFQYAEVELKGSCPKISYIKNLNIPRIVGWWYRCYSTLDNPLCFNNEGQTMYAAEYNEKVINVDICCRSASSPYRAACGGDIGSGTVTDTSNPGEFLYEFAGDSYNIYVLDTDYVNFAIVYGCKPKGFRRHSPRDELIFVLCRGYKLNEELEDRIRKVLQQNGSDLSNAKSVKQSPFTPYTPGSKPCGGGRGPR